MNATTDGTGRYCKANLLANRSVEEHREYDTMAHTTSTGVEASSRRCILEKYSQIGQNTCY